jgi:hypothetical protein
MLSPFLRKAVFVCVCSSAAPLVAACGDPEASAPPLTEVDQPFATGLAGEPVHEEVTAEGLSFLRSEVITALQAANVSTDIEFLVSNAHHFDDCNFSGGADVIRARQSEAVDHLNPALGGLEQALAMRAFGLSLHTVQDFYAHSNWVEDGGTSIVESSLGAWPALVPYSVLEPSGFLVVQGNPPAGIAIWRQRGASYPSNAIVFARIGSSSRYGIMSGTVDYEPGNFCPAQIAMTHDELNKDRATRHPAQFVEARDLAVEQTTQEWCRLLTMTRSAWGEGGDAQIFAWVEDEQAASQCGDPADLSVGFAASSASSVAVGESATISVDYANAGPATAYGAAIHVSAPAGLAMSSASCTSVEGGVDCALGALDAGASGVVALTVTALASGAHQLDAQISGHVPESNAQNDAASLVVTVP